MTSKQRLTPEDQSAKEFSAGFDDFVADVDREISRITEGLTTASFPKFNAARAYVTGKTIKEAAEACLSTSKTGRLFLEGF